MTLVHCARCGFLYESGDSIGVVMELHKSGGFVGDICYKCYGSDYNPVKGWSNMWYVDWIAKRQKRLEK